MSSGCRSVAVAAPLASPQASNLHFSSHLALNVTFYCIRVLDFVLFRLKNGMVKASGSHQSQAYSLLSSAMC